MPPPVLFDTLLIATSSSPKSGEYNGGDRNQKREATQHRKPKICQKLMFLGAAKKKPRGLLRDERTWFHVYRQIRCLVNLPLEVGAVDGFDHSDGTPNLGIEIG